MRGRNSAASRSVAVALWVAVAAGVVSCSASGPPQSLERNLVAIPEYGAGYDSGGSYLQFSGPAELVDVNAALRDLVLDDLRRHQRDFPPPKTVPEYPGSYQVGGARADVVANTDLVSVLIPVSHGLPGGNPHSGFLARTVLVPSAERVMIEDLLEDPAAAFAALERLAKERLRADVCVGTIGEAVDGDWDTAEKYGRFALTPEGLVIGFEKYEVAQGACGGVRIVIAWDGLQSMLTARAREWIRELGAPSSGAVAHSRSG
ncbi:RsiV family protein [Catellatospora paridis]|uniref:RsiV family protein n=1 Tax=Catellatospora paridis TaxID=1617086 RepID=UPI0012D3824F|nr:RsiV family protein [Catellatospora paridis]